VVPTGLRRRWTPSTARTCSRTCGGRCSWTSRLPTPHTRTASSARATSIRCGRCRGCVTCAGGAVPCTPSKTIVCAVRARLCVWRAEQRHRHAGAVAEVSRGVLLREPDDAGHRGQVRRWLWSRTAALHPDASCAPRALVFSLWLRSLTVAPISLSPVVVCVGCPRRQSLDALQKWATEMFSPIRNTGRPAPVFSGIPYRPEQLALQQWYVVSRCVRCGAGVCVEGNHMHVLSARAGSCP
jgi:hypothetical protein